MIDYRSYRAFYKDHLHLNPLVSDKNITYCSFDEWLKMYRADPGNWEGIETLGTVFPAYKLSSSRRQFIKFRSKRDYKRWISYMANEQESQEEIDNLNELLELTKVIQARAEKAREESEAELKKLVKDNYALWRETVYENSVSPLPTKRARW